MRALIQRVDRASVEVEEEIVGSIGKGLLIFVGIGIDDNKEDLVYLAEKIINLRVFPDENSKFKFSVNDVSGELLLVSQFTLYADTSKGRRPGFTKAAPPDKAELLFNELVKYIKQSNLKVQTGRFQQHMIVNIINNGPVTILIDSKIK